MGYTPNRRGMEAMLCAPFMQADMHRRAERGLELAAAIAPEETGHFKESLGTSSGVREGHKTRRAYGRLASDDPAALSIEFGNHHQDGHHTMTQALEVMGE